MQFGGSYWVDLQICVTISTIDFVLFSCCRRTTYRLLYASILPDSLQHLEIVDGLWGSICLSCSHALSMTLVFYNIVECIDRPFLSLLATILLHSLATLYFSGHWHSDSCVLLWMLLSMFLCFQFLWVSIWEWSCWVAFQDCPDSQCLVKQPHWSTLLPVVR